MKTGLSPRAGPAVLGKGPAGGKRCTSDDGIVCLDNIPSNASWIVGDHTRPLVFTSRLPRQTLLSILPGPSRLARPRLLAHLPDERPYPATSISGQRYEGGGLARSRKHKGCGNGTKRESSAIPRFVAPEAVACKRSNHWARIRGPASPGKADANACPDPFPIRATTIKPAIINLPSKHLIRLAFCAVGTTLDGEVLWEIQQRPRLGTCDMHARRPVPLKTGLI